MFLGRRFMRIQIACQNGLGIHDDLPPARQTGQPCRGEAGLPSTVTDSCSKKSQCADHAGQFGHALERDLTPLAADGRRPKRLHQVAGLRLQALLRLGQDLRC